MENDYYDRDRREDGLKTGHPYSGYLFASMGVDEFIAQDQRNNGYIIGQPNEWLTLHTDSAKVLAQADDEFQSPQYVVLGVIAQQLSPWPVPGHDTDDVHSSERDEPTRRRKVKCDGRYDVPFLNPTSYIPMSPMALPTGLRNWKTSRDAILRLGKDASQLALEAVAYEDATRFLSYDMNRFMMSICKGEAVNYRLGHVEALHEAHKLERRC